MFEEHLVDPAVFRNVIEKGETIGYEVALRIPYYRGIPMSCVQEISLTVDGDSVATEDMIITVKGEDFRYSELSTVINHRWEMVDPIYVFVKRDGGLSQGSHIVRAFVCLRISYQPHPNTGTNEKTLELGAPKRLEGSAHYGN